MGVSLRQLYVFFTTFLRVCRFNRGSERRLIERLALEYLASFNDRVGVKLLHILQLSCFDEKQTVNLRISKILILCSCLGPYPAYISTRHMIINLIHWQTTHLKSKKWSSPVIMSISSKYPQSIKRQKQIFLTRFNNQIANPQGNV